MLDEIAAFLDVELGASLARIRSKPPSDGLREEDRARIRAHCRTAAALGYTLDPDSEVVDGASQCVDAATQAEIR